MWLCGSMLHVYLYQDLHFILIGQLHVDLRSDWTVRFSIVFWLNSDMLYCVLIGQWHVLMADNQVALDNFHTSLGSEELTCIMHIKVIENREVNEKGSSLGPNGKCPKWELALGTLHLHYYHNTEDGDHGNIWKFTIDRELIIFYGTITFECLSRSLWYYEGCQRIKLSFAVHVVWFLKTFFKFIEFL